MSKTISTKNYDIIIGEEIFTEIKNYLHKNNYSKIFVLVDENTRRFCLPILILHMNNISHFNFIQIPSGEENKNIQTCCYAWEKLSELGADRKSLLINFGGGVLGDMGGFIASTFMRGIDYINIPTTLLSMVDASIGGKIGIDFNKVKNQIGLFVNPKAVYIMSGFLNTLPERQIYSGFAEIIKHALIKDYKYWKEIQMTNILSEKALEILIEKSITIKKNVVNKDPLEKGPRKILNFGHTIGHAIETYSLLNDKTPLLHGEAVAIGIICESFLSNRTTGLPMEEFKEISDFIFLKFKKYDLQPESFNELINLMKHDKKNEKEKINFTLLKKIGSGVINQTCSENDIYGSFRYYQQLWN